MKRDTSSTLSRDLLIAIGIAFGALLIAPNFLSCLFTVLLMAAYVFFH